MVTIIKTNKKLWLPLYKIIINNNDKKHDKKEWLPWKENCQDNMIKTILRSAGYHDNTKHYIFIDLFLSHIHMYMHSYIALTIHLLIRKIRISEMHSVHVCGWVGRMGACVRSRVCTYVRACAGEWVRAVCVCVCARVCVCGCVLCSCLCACGCVDLHVHMHVRITNAFQD